MGRQRGISAVLGFSLATLLAAAVAQAAAPAREFPYTKQTNLQPGAYKFVFSLYASPAAAKPLWTSGAVALTLKTPVLVYTLGSGTRKIPASINFAQQLYLKVEKTAPGARQVVVNRERFPVSPYALASSTVSFGGSGTATTAARSDHTHAAGDVASGTFPVERLPVGTAATQVAAGDHTHAAGDVASGTFPVERLPVGTAATQVAAGDHTHDGAHYFAQDLAGWTVVTGQGGTAVSASPLAGGRVFTNAVNQAPWLSSSVRIPTNMHWTYEVRGSFRRQNLNGSAGGIYLAVRLFDETGADIGGDGTWWFYPASNVQLTDTAWHTFSAKFGSSTARPFPANARFMAVGAILNFDGVVAGNRIYEVTGLQIAPSGRPPIYVADSRVGCPPSGATTGVTALMTTGSFTLDRPAYVNVTANIISKTLGRRDVSLYVDGASQTSHLARTETNDWVPHQVQWTGSLGAGAHTIELRAGNSLAGSDGYGCGGAWGRLSVLFLD